MQVSRVWNDRYYSTLILSEGLCPELGYRTHSRVSDNQHIKYIFQVPEPEMYESLL